MRERHLQCFAHGQDGLWQAICVDLDIAVEGRSLQEVFTLLNEAIASYIEYVQTLEEEDRIRLLNRRSPFWVRVGYWARFLWHARPRFRHGGEAQASFEVPCRA